MSLVMLASSFARVQRHNSVARCGTWLSRGFATVDTSSSETHDDFKPKYKAPPVSDAHAQIEADIKGHDVFVYMKGDPQQPQCGFSNTACRVLTAYGVQFGSRNVLADPAIRDGVKRFSNWPTIPQVFVKGEFIGGSDILFNMHETGELEKLLGPIIEKQQAAGTK